ncbi:MAG: glycosyltransferase [Thermofilaceae archaeon]
MRTVSVLILSKNNGGTLGRTLLSILKSRIPPGWYREIVVVDARSSDNTPVILSRFKGYIKVVYDEGKGIGIARNLGVVSAKGDVICFVDADCVVGPEHFVKVIQAIEEGVDIVDVKGCSGPSETFLEELESIIWTKGRAYSEELKKNRCFAGGAFISFRREVFERVKGFWLHPPYGGDDLDFSYRAYRAGFKIKVVDSPGTYSRFRRSIKELVKQQIGWGKGYAHVIARYRNEKSFWKCYRWSRSVYLLFNDLVYLYPILAAMLAPIKGLLLAFRLSNWQLLPYWVLRRYAFLLGMLTELRRAFISQSDAGIGNKASNATSLP